MTKGHGGSPAGPYRWARPDDETWLHHLRAGDYSRWMADDVSDTDLAEQIADVERDRDLMAKDSRARARELVLDRYTQAAEPDPDTSAPG